MKSEIFVSFNFDVSILIHITIHVLIFYRAFYANARQEKSCQKEMKRGAWSRNLFTKQHCFLQETKTGWTKSPHLCTSPLGECMGWMPPVPPLDARRNRVYCVHDMEVGILRLPRECAHGCVFQDTFRCVPKACWLEKCRLLRKGFGCVVIHNMFLRKKNYPCTSWLCCVRELLISKMAVKITSRKNCFFSWFLSGFFLYSALSTPHFALCPHLLLWDDMGALLYFATISSSFHCFFRKLWEHASHILQHSFHPHIFWLKLIF